MTGHGPIIHNRSQARAMPATTRLSPSGSTRGPWLRPHCDIKRDDPVRYGHRSSVATMDPRIKSEGDNLICCREHATTCNRVNDNCVCDPAAGDDGPRPHDPEPQPSSHHASYLPLVTLGLDPRVHGRGRVSAAPSPQPSPRPSAEADLRRQGGAKEIKISAPSPLWGEGRGEGQGHNWTIADLIFRRRIHGWGRA